MNDKQKQLLALADELGVGPSELKALRERHGRCAPSMIHGGSYIMHGCEGRHVDVSFVRSDERVMASLHLTADDAIRWGESLAAAGRAAQK